MIDQAVAKHELAKAAVKVAEADVASAQAKLGEVRAGVSRAEADVARWQAEYKRVEQLHRERALTGTLVDETLSKLRSAEASREEIQAQVKTAEAALVQSSAALEQARAEVAAAVAPIEVARQDAHRVEALLSYTRIEAPYDGIVTARNVDTGNLTQPGATSQPLFVVARSDIVTIKVDVPEAYRHRGEPRRPCPGQAPGDEGQDGRGEGHPDLVVTRPQDADDPRRDRHPQSRRHAPARPLRLRNHHRRRACKCDHPSHDRHLPRERQGLLRGRRRRQGCAEANPAWPERRQRGPRSSRAWRGTQRRFPS